MPNFLENIFSQLKRADGRFGLQPGDRCALLATNSVRWVTFNLALMAEGAIVVPLYSRQAPAELAAMMKDCRPRFLFAGDAALGAGIAQAWPEAPPRILFQEVFQQPASSESIPDIPSPRQNSDIVTIIYTSGTSGEPKGVCLNVGNITHMISCTTERLDQLMGET